MSDYQSKPPANLLQSRVIRFGLVGVFNTLSNLLLFNIFIFTFNFSVSVANITSLTISICISFALNMKFVFKRGDEQKLHLVFVSFMLFSLFSQLIVQQLIVMLFVDVVTLPGDIVNAGLHYLPLLSQLSKRFYIVNTAKLLAVSVSLLVNYISYDKFVFTQKSSAN